MTLPCRYSEDWLGWLQNLEVCITAITIPFRQVAGGSLTLPYILSTEPLVKLQFELLSFYQKSGGVSMVKAKKPPPFWGGGWVSSDY